MGRHIWGKAAGTLVLAATVAAASGCSSSSDDAKPPASSSPAATVSVADATTEFQAMVTKFDEDGGCLEQEPDTCWEQMQALIQPARGLRKAMRAEKSVGPEFWTGAYTLIDKMEKGIAVGRDRGATAIGTNRPEVLGSAHDLSDWLDENPIS
ncbi:hypothetical protein ACIQVK_44825 [Streptomyces sp. NPDC090493]|uniref:hypothetical protein n=1 Tax=Streptomyces sp. NPDC090493 TaxID=3365964 RepID=UPI00381C24EC